MDINLYFLPVTVCRMWMHQFCCAQCRELRNVDALPCRERKDMPSFCQRYDPTVSVSSVTGEHRETMRLRKIRMFSPGQRQVLQCNPRRNLGHTLENFGRTLEPCGICFMLCFFSLYVENRLIFHTLVAYKQ